MTIHVRVFRGCEPLYGRTTPPESLDDVRRVSIANGGETMRSIKRFDADGERIVLRAADMGDFFHVVVTESMNEGHLFSGMTRNGLPFPVVQSDVGEEWWVVLSKSETNIDDALPGYRYDGTSMVCVHDEHYLKEKASGEDEAFIKWLAAEQIANDREVFFDEPERPLYTSGEAPQSWTYCQDVLGPLLAFISSNHNGAIPAATVLAAMQAMAACSFGETRKLIEGLIGDRWSSSMRPFDILGLTPRKYCSPKYCAYIATSTWIADRLKPSDECKAALSNVGVEEMIIDTDINKACRNISSWIREKTQGDFAPVVKLDPLSEFVVVSAMLFKDAWNDAFEKSDSESGAFFGEGGIRTITFMRGLREGSVSRFDRCKAASLKLTTGASIVFVLPNRGVGLTSLLENGEALRAASAHVIDHNSDCDVDWWLPKFDVFGSIEGSGEKLIPGIEALMPSTNFSPVAGAEISLIPKYASEARVKIDEEGIEATGYTLFAVAAAGMPPEEPPVIPFVLDRPFAFVLVSNTQEPMFIGAVNHPEGY